jgi:hypothetical protein
MGNRALDFARVRSCAASFRFLQSASFLFRRLACFLLEALLLPPRGKDHLLET